MFKQWLNYHHLYYFMIIAESGSISKAAEKLSVGQPTLSSQLKQFEDHLGINLFERHHKKLILTEHGKLTLEYAKNIFKLGREMYEVLHDRIQPNKMSVQFGALDSIPKQVMLQLTQSTLKIAPCSISLVEGKFDELMRDLTSHKIDLVISNFLPKLGPGKGMFHKIISSRPLNIYGSPKFKSLRRKFPQSLNKCPIVLPTYDSQMRYDLDHWLESNQISMNVIAETQDTALKKLMATHDMAVIPAAAHTVQRLIKSKELILIGEMANLREDLFLISSQRKIVNPIASELMRTFTL